MIFTPTDLAGVVVVDVEPHPDDRGFFARAFADVEFEAAGLMSDVVHVNISNNRRAGTLRGLHYQREPHPDPKIVRCIRGALYDVVVDLRPESASYCEWVGLRLDADGRRSLHVPAGCAHGFVTLEDDTELLYLMGSPYHADLAAGVRWDDPAFGIDWPLEPVVMSNRDATYPDFAR